MLADDIDHALPGLRAEVEALMVSACLIERLSEPVLDETTGLYTPTRTLVYEGKCDLQFGNTAARDVTPQAQTIVEQAPTLKLPVNGTASILPGDVGTLTAHPNDPDKVGMTFRVGGIHTRTWATMRRIPIEVLT